ncbi:MAG: hypothetical protein J6A38_01310 [Clostridia bacterium]|nr:hypothetical protein [Clostridia bacterium]
MEERIIDDEYGRGIRLKKTKEGYVDVTDELAEQEEQEVPTQETENETADEIAFEFPMMDTDEDDEDLVGLSPEEALALRQKKEAELAQRKADYDRLCQEGEALLQSGSFHASELKYEKALALDEEATEASVGYWRAKTSDFAEPDVLIDEYVEAGIESLEYDLGYDASEIIKREYRAVFEKRIRELEAEEKPLAEEVEGKIQLRRGYLKERVKKAGIAFAIATVPMLVALVLTVVFGLKNFSTPDSAYILPTIVIAGVTVVLFIVFAVFTNKFINACRMRRANEKLASTEDGETLVYIRDKKELYQALLITVDETSQEE